MWPFNRGKHAFASGFEPVCHGPVREGQVRQLADRGYRFITGPDALGTGSFAKHPVMALLPSVLQVFRLLGLAGPLAALEERICVVAGISGEVAGTEHTQGLAARTDDVIHVPNSFVVQISAGSLAQLYDRAKALSEPGGVLSVFPKIGLPDLEAREERSRLLMRGFFMSLALLVLHEFAHVARNHHALVQHDAIADDPRLVGVGDAASRRRIVEVDADFLAMLMLAKFQQLIPPGLATAEQSDAGFRFAWCLLASFTMFSVFADQSAGGDADAPEDQRLYYSPLVRCHVLPLAASATLGLDPAEADAMLQRFYAALAARHAQWPILARYADWQYLFDGDLKNWRATETERVSWQSSGFFYALLRADARP